MCCFPLVRVIFSFPGENSEPRNIANLDVNVTQEANGGHILCICFDFALVNSMRSTYFRLLLATQEFSRNSRREASFQPRQTSQAQLALPRPLHAKILLVSAFAYLITRAVTQLSIYFARIFLPASPEAFSTRFLLVALLAGGNSCAPPA